MNKLPHKGRKAFKLKRDFKGWRQMARESSVRGISVGRHPKFASKP